MKDTGEGDILESQYEQETKEQMAIELLKSGGASMIQESAAFVDIASTTLFHRLKVGLLVLLSTTSAN
jgi:hypothetical protein